MSNVLLNIRKVYLTHWDTGKYYKGFVSDLVFLFSFACGIIVNIVGNLKQFSFIKNIWHINSLVGGLEIVEDMPVWILIPCAEN